MLTSVIDRLTTLGSKHFVIGGFVPVLVFAFFNGVLLYIEFDWFHDWADPQISGTSRAFDVAAVGVGLAVAAYVLWSLNSFLIQVLEGRRLKTGSRLRSWLTAAQQERWESLNERLDTARETRSNIARDEPRWRAALSAAGVEGLFRTDSAGNKTPNTAIYDGTGDAANTLQQLRQRQRRAQDITHAELKAAVDAFAQVLRSHSKRAENASAALLDTHHDALLKSIEYARNRWLAREVALANQVQWRFGLDDVAPTAFGNVAAALQNYGLTRYGINLPTFWSRLQAVLQSDKEFFGTIQDAKSQLDFHVSCCWLAVLTTVVWSPVLAIWGSSPARIVATMVGGPLVARLCYVAAVENYIVFGEVVRSSIDLHRLRLLDALHVRRPTGLRDERHIWSELQRVTAYGQESVDIGYRQAPAATESKT
jgi:hypothetical protein